jgi:uncharacterized protein YukE
MGEMIVIDSETGEETTRPLTPEEEAQKAQDEANYAAAPRPKLPDDYQEEWQQLNQELQDLGEQMDVLTDAWAGATSQQRLDILYQGIGLNNQALRIVNRKLSVVANSLARGIWEEAEYEEEAPA